MTSSMNFEQIDVLLDGNEGTEAYQQLVSLKNESNQEDIGLNRRIGQACYILANRSDEKKQRRALLLEGYEHIKKAYEKAPTDASVLHWAPIIIGSLSENADGNKERIKYGHEFKKYIDEAITQLPAEAALYHMRGRFRYEVASLSFVERSVASMFFGSPPYATYEEALEDLLKAEEMDPDAIDNMLFLGKTYKALKNVKEARRWLSKAANKQATDCVDKEQIEEATKLLNKLPSPTPKELADINGCDDTAQQLSNASK